MKRIFKTPGPNLLTQYAKVHPDGEWETGFRPHNNRQDYNTTRDLMVSDQGGLCGYCETQITDENLPRRVEHFHDKSDKSSSHNWHLDWSNVFAVCNGGSGYETDHTLYPPPDNLSCDAHKSHLKNSGFTPPEGYILNPLTLIATPSLFTLNKREGKLLASEENCAAVQIEENSFNSVAELVSNTITVLNLNCYRLTEQRHALLVKWSQELKRSSLMNDPDHMHRFVAHWLSPRWAPFFTTRRLIAGKFAEHFLDATNYQY